jgi:hypothetical protein
MVDVHGCLRRRFAFCRTSHQSEPPAWRLPVNRIAQISLASLAVAAVACKGDLPKETSPLDLSESGLALALEVPSGAEVR